MAKRKEQWMMGRTNHVRVYLTDEEYALVKAAAYLADRSLSRFSVESIIAAARKAVPEDMPPPGGKAKPKKGGRK